MKTKTVATKAKTKPRGRPRLNNHSDLGQLIYFKVPENYLESVDKMASLDDRSRSSYLRQLLIGHIEGTLAKEGKSVT